MKRNIGCLLLILVLIICGCSREKDKIIDSHLGDAINFWKETTVYNDSDQFNPLFKPSAEDLNKVIRMLEYVVKKNPNLGNAHYYLAVAYMHRKDNEMAASEFERSIHLGVEDELAYELLFSLYVNKRENSKVSELINEYSKKFPEREVQLLSYEIRFLYFSGQYEHAINKAKRLIALDKNNQMAHLILAKTYYSKKDMPKAKNEFNKFLELEPILKKSVQKNEIKMEDILKD